MEGKLMKNARPIRWIEERLETHKTLLSLLFQERCRLCSRPVEYCRWDPGLVSGASNFLCETLCNFCLEEVLLRKPVLGLHLRAWRGPRLLPACGKRYAI